jgi:hypothetical protein
MTKKEALQRKEVLEKELQVLNTIISQPEKTKEQRFFELFNGLQLKFDFEKYRDRLFFFRGDEVWLIYDLKDKYLWVLHEKWEVFENEYSMDYDEIQTFIKNMVERHFNLKGVEPRPILFTRAFTVERHFNLKGVEPRNPL